MLLLWWSWRQRQRRDGMESHDQVWTSRHHTHFKAFVAIGNYNGHVCFGIKCSKEVATAIRSVIILAKLSILLNRGGFWRNKIGRPHTTRNQFVSTFCP
jgi:ribosomal protein S5